MVKTGFNSVWLGFVVPHCSCNYAAERESAFHLRMVEKSHEVVNWSYSENNIAALTSLHLVYS
jgi:hypothetical protein